MNSVLPEGEIVPLSLSTFLTTLPLSFSNSLSPFCLSLSPLPYSYLAPMITAFSGVPVTVQFICSLHSSCVDNQRMIAILLATVLWGLVGLHGEEGSWVLRLGRAEREQPSIPSLPQHIVLLECAAVNDKMVYRSAATSFQLPASSPFM